MCNFVSLNKHMFRKECLQWHTIKKQWQESNKAFPVSSPLSALLFLDKISRSKVSAQGKRFSCHGQINCVCCEHAHWLWLCVPLTLIYYYEQFTLWTLFFFWGTEASLLTRPDCSTRIHEPHEPHDTHTLPHKKYTSSDKKSNTELKVKQVKLTNER